MKRLRVPLIAVMTLGLLTLPACYAISQTASDPGYPLHHDWSPGIPIESGIANSCVFSSHGQGVADLCRVVDGYEETGDHRNWDIRATCTPYTVDIFGTWYCIPDASEVKVWGSPWDTYGMIVGTAGGEIYEGCRWYEVDNTTINYWCDYRIRKEITIRYSTGGEYMPFWDLWPGYIEYLATDVLGCVSFIVGIWYGFPFNLPGLAACAYSRPL